MTHSAITRKIFNDIHISDTDINILLLGETGVGKSTFINATYFYLKHETTQQAIQDEFVPIIPFTFIFQDGDGEEHTIEGGEKSSIENTSVVGESSTQECFSYAFNHNGKTFRMIDTPGVGDTRGFEQDMKHFQEISSRISKFTHINAVCFLMKPHAARLTAEIRYCFSELLRHLSKSTRDNLTFIFTHARTTFFKPAGMKPLIARLIKENKENHGLDLQFTNSNTFFFDNESFRCLAILRQGFKLDEEMTQCLKISWEKTRKEYVRFVEYLTSRPVCRATDIVDLIDAERVIRKLPRPIANILQLIEENIALSEKFKHNNVATAERVLEQRKAAVIRLPYPRTVCTGERCCRMVEDDDEKRIEFLKICHDQCYLNGIAQEVIGDERLDCCQIIDPYTRTCRECGCSWKKHRHITYEYKTVMERASPLNDIDKRVRDLRQELQKINEISEKLDLFLQANALIPINDAIVEYLDHFIQAEREKEKNNHSIAIDRLEQWRNEMVQNRHAKKADRRAAQIPAVQEITPLLQEIFNLPINGAMIHEQVQEIGNLYASSRFEEIHVELPTTRTDNTLRKVMFNA